MKRSFLLNYAGVVTSLLTLDVFVSLMLQFTKKDTLEILIAYICFILPFSYLLPFIIMEAKDDAK